MRVVRRAIVRPSPDLVRAIEKEAGRSAVGQIAAIDMRTRRFFLGETVIDAALLGRRELHDPKREFYFIRVGFPAVDRHRGRLKPL